MTDVSHAYDLHCDAVHVEPQADECTSTDTQDTLEVARDALRELRFDALEVMVEDPAVRAAMIVDAARVLHRASVALGIERSLGINLHGVVDVDRLYAELLAAGAIRGGIYTDIQDCKSATTGGRYRAVTMRVDSVEITLYGVHVDIPPVPPKRKRRRRKS